MFHNILMRVSEVSRKPRLVLVLLTLWGLFILYGTLLPFDFSAGSSLIEWRLRRLWERPVRGLGGSWADVWSNILLFVPWGLLLGLWRGARSRTGFLATLALALLSAASLSGSVEFLQLLAPGRTTSVVDLITNTFGAGVGALIGWPLAVFIWPVVSVRIRQLLEARPMGACALAIMISFLFAGLTPAYVKTERHGVVAAIESARWIPFGSAPGAATPRAKVCLWGAEFLAYTLFGGVLVTAVRESGRSGFHAVGMTVAAAGSLSLAIEGVQIFVPGRDVDLTSVVLACSGAAVGGTAVASLRHLAWRDWTIPALVIWALAALLTEGNPLQFAWPTHSVWQAAAIVPFWSYFGSRSLEDLTDVIAQAMLFVPLGALWPARSGRRSFVSVILAGFCLGAMLEVGQAFLPERSIDISDAISASAGAGLGLAVWRWGDATRTSSMGAARYRVRTYAGRST